MAEIDELHDRFGSAYSLPDYFRALAAAGVVRFESIVSDGHTEFVAAGGQRVASPPHHETFDVAESADRDAVVEHLRRHAEGETSYVEMSAGLAASGVDRWVGDTGDLTMTYRDRAGKSLLVERID